jgi:hypothetical protein
MSNPNNSDNKIWSLPQFAKSSRRLRAIATFLFGTMLVFLSYYLDNVRRYNSTSTDNSAFEIAIIALREIGFALVVAVIIWLVFEYFARAENEAMWRERVLEITSNVFYAVHGVSLPADYISFANEVILSAKLIRKGWDVHYVLRDSTFKDESTTINFVELTCVSRYKIVNISNSSWVYPLKITLPLPANPKLQNTVGVSGILLWQRGKKLTARLTKQVSHGCIAEVTYHAGDVIIYPEEEIEVAITFTLVKNLDDTEVVQTLYPTDSLRLAIVDQGSSDRLIGAKSIHVDTLENDTPDGAGNTRQYRINRYLLPHNGIIFWWNLYEENAN